MSNRNPLLQLEEVSVRYRAETSWAVDRVNVRLYPGEFLALIGESGSGKTTIANTIMGLLPAGCEQKGRLDFKGRTLLGQSQKNWELLRGAELGYVPQQPVAALNPVRTIGSQVAELFHLRSGVGGDEAWRLAADLLEQVQLKDVNRVMKAYPHEISGGMAQRAVLAMAISLNPSLLIADEPTTAVDAELRENILADIKRQQETRHLGVMFISHDLALVGRYADRLAVMFGGRVVESGNAAQIFSLPQHPYTRLLLELDSVGEGVDLAEPQFTGGCGFARRCDYARAQCRKEEPAWQGSEMQGWACYG